MIINGELQTGIGGGVCQVSTTVFNAAFEAGPLDRAADEPRALHRPLPARPGRDGELPRPRSRVHRTTPTAGCCSGRSSARARSPSTSTARRRTGASRPRRRRSRSTARSRGSGSTTRRSSGARRSSSSSASPPRSTAVTRRVYAPDGTLMYDTTWRSYYVGEPTVVRLGTKPRPKPEEPKAEGRKAERRRRPTASRRRPRRSRRRRRRRLLGPERRPRRTRRAPGSDGRVTASTVACAVQPCATRSPSRVTTYS